MKRVLLVALIALTLVAPVLMSPTSATADDQPPLTLDSVQAG